MTAKCKNKCANAKQGVDHDNKIFNPSSSLHTEKNHKDWYHADNMGKQRGKPKYDLKNAKKKKK